jgi:hypothetical protein
MHGAKSQGALPLEIPAAPVGRHTVPRPLALIIHLAYRAPPPAPPWAVGSKKCPKSKHLALPLRPRPFGPRELPDRTLGLVPKVLCRTFLIITVYLGPYCNDLISLAFSRGGAASAPRPWTKSLELGQFQRNLNNSEALAKKIVMCFSHPQRVQHRFPERRATQLQCYSSFL